MKKLLIVLLALTVVGIFAFADDAAPAAAAPVVTISDWGRQVFVIGNQDNNNGYYAGTQASWGSNPRIVGLNIQAHNENAGFSITPCADNGTFGLTDQNKAWISPLAGLTFETGLNLENDTWRGSSDFGSDDWLRFQGVAVGGNSSTFARLGEGGYMTDLNYNKDGIGAWVAFQNDKAASGDSVAAKDFKNAFQAGAAYTIAGIATIKAQYLGANVSGTGMMGNISGAQIINGAVNVSAVKGLYEEIGVIYPLTDVGYDFAFADDASFAVAALTIHARVQGVNYNSKAVASGLALAGGAGVDYDLGSGFGVSADFQYVSKQQETQANYNPGKAAVAATEYALGTKAVDPVLSTDALTGFGVYVKKAFSNGFIGIGFEYSSIGFAGTSTTNAYSHWAVPIVVSESF
jgi:hypothetical protein